MLILSPPCWFNMRFPRSPTGSKIAHWDAEFSRGVAIVTATSIKRTAKAGGGTGEGLEQVRS